MKPQVFIGSSSEGLAVAYSLQSNLDEAADVTVWNQDVFHPSEFILESLLKQLPRADLGIFVFSPDDLISMRGVEHATVRDNVIFEFGLFVGHLGRDKSIIVAPKGENPRLPSDLLGVNILKYRAEREDRNLDAALGPASAKIRALLASVQSKADKIPRELDLPMMERRDLLSSRQRKILNAIEAQKQCSLQDLAKLFPGIAQSELIYRLEQLRLLMFISKYEANPTGNSTTPLYSLSDAYRHAARNRPPPLGSRSAGPLG
jgi:hypothetical protein